MLNYQRVESEDVDPCHSKIFDNIFLGLTKVYRNPGDPCGKSTKNVHIKASAGIALGIIKERRLVGVRPSCLGE